MKIKLWGVRGSIPTPLNGDAVKQKVRRALLAARPGDISSEEAVDSFIDTLPFSVRSTYGGNTTCIEVVTNSGDEVILDCGSGLARLGKELMKGSFARGEGTASIFMTHTHWDHLQGIPFFAPFYIEGNSFNFYSPFIDLMERLQYQHSPSHFPISLDFMPAEKNYFTVTPEEYFELNDLTVYVKKMPHPGGAYAFRIEHEGKVFVYTSDCEFSLDEAEHVMDYAPLFSDADVVLFDAQYTFEESINKTDWGHSSATIAIDIAGRFNVKRLILFHHDPDYSDEKLDIVLANSRIYQKMNASKNGSLQVDIAYEGMEIVL